MMMKELSAIKAAAGKAVKQSTTLDLIVLVLSFIFLCPATAHAYLDPGSGNIIIYVLMSLVGTLLYSLKGLFWRLVSPEKNDAAANHGLISIFSEGKNYWGTFKPIVTALIDAGQPFSYYSMDIDDPGLTIESGLMESKYIGEGSAAFARTGQLRSKIMIATTPNIGTPGFPMPRPPQVASLFHVCHAVDDISLYHRGSLDHYDGVFIVGDFMISGIRELERKRGLKQKRLEPGGLPYLDDLASKMKKDRPPTNGNTVLVAPTWGEKGMLAIYGSAFIRKLAEADFDVILRPHPHSWKVEHALMDKIKAELKNVKNIEWDDDPDGSKSLERADIMISEASGVRMDFALLYERPVITVKKELEHPEQYEIADMDKIWMRETELVIGDVLSSDEMENIVPVVRQTLKTAEKRDLKAFRDANVYHFGRSGTVIADCLIAIINDDKEQPSCK
jgi:hypothetical protein